MTGHDGTDRFAMLRWDWLSVHFVGDENLVKGERGKKRVRMGG
tara:strand:+ start:501 stop:629 length:129 start_codon:yes stop_codon:yes gene_type:complete